MTTNMMYDIEIKVSLGSQSITRDYKVEDPYEQTDFQKEISSMADYLSDERNLEI